MGGRWLAGVALAVAGCSARVIVAAESEGESSSGSSSTGDTRDDSEDDGSESSGPAVLDVGTVSPPSQRFVSILFVIDDSVSMGAPQVALTASIGVLIDSLEEAGVDYRLAFTTTDNDNLWCAGDFISAPEGGKFVSSSCKTRLFDFVSVEANEHSICLEQCRLDELVFEASRTEIDPALRFRPWVESVGGVANLPLEIDVLDALGCMMPQGVAGCGFEQPLESMYKAIRRTQLADEGEYGFFNPAGLAVVVFVSDEVDCSYNLDHEVIFDPDGNRVFWSEPEDAVPTSAICWNAGVRCEGDESMLACTPESYDVDGNPGVLDDDAVLQPVTRYIGVLAELGNAYVAAIDGVPLGYASGAEEIRYARDGDPEFLYQFGIAPGCENGEIRAVPPARLRSVVEATNGVGTRDLFSICDLDYGAHLKTIAERILVRLPP